jgi:serine/threonine protein kinase
MPRQLTCPNGHRWELPSAAPPPGGDSLVCPVCGTQTETVLAPVGLATPTRRPSSSDPSSVTQSRPGTPARPNAAAALPAIAGYEVLEEVGRGGMGIVYKARQFSTGRLVALKVIRRERLLAEDSVRRFRREVQAAARLTHPNIVLVYDSDQSGDTHFLAMEYVDGITLQRLVEVEGPLPPARACDYVRQAALGLQHAHEQALVHRDVKPANLMLAGWRPASGWRA